MSKIKKKYIKLGTGTDDLNAQDLPANYTAVNYTPTQVASEGTSKISAHLKGLDIQLGVGGLGYADLQEVASITSPASGYDRLQTKTDGFLYLKKATGTEIQLTGNASTVVKSTTVSTATTGTFNTSKNGSPEITLRFWDNSLSTFDYLSTASYGISINALGNTISYDFTTKTFDASDYIEILAVYTELLTSVNSNEYDSGWITVSGINNTPSAGFHRVNLPSGFTTTPPGYTLTLNDGTNITPGNLASQLSFDSNLGTQRITMDTTGLSGTDSFRITASTSVRPTSLSPSTTLYGTLLTKTASYTITDSDDALTIVVSDSTAPRTITLPSAASNVGRVLIIKNSSSQGGTVSVVPAGVATIDGTVTQDITTQYDSIMVQSDGTNWHIL